MKTVLLPLQLVVVVSALFFSGELRAAETGATVTNLSAVPVEPQPQVTLEQYRQVRDQLEALQQASGQSREQSEAAARQNEVLTDRMLTLEKMLVAQREREFELIRSANRFGLTVLAASTGAAILAILISIWFQSRCVNRLLEVATRFPALQGRELPLLENGDPGSGARLMGALKLLENRIHELEHATGSQAGAPASGPSGEESSSHSHFLQTTHPGAGLSGSSAAQVLMAKGQTLLDMERPQEALNCLEEAITLDPRIAEAHLKKGVALERSKKMEQSLASYEEALRLNPGLTVAYLYKGRVLQELERYDDALVCYERALSRRPSQKAVVESLAV